MAEKSIDHKTKIGTGAGDNGGAFRREPQVNPSGLGEHGRVKGGGWSDGPLPEGSSYGVNAHRPRRDKTGP